MRRITQLLAVLATLALTIAPSSAASVFVASSRTVDGPGKAVAFVNDSLRFSMVEVASPSGRALSSIAGMDVQGTAGIARGTFLRDAVRKGHGQVVVFVHGYNTSFLSSVRRTAQIGEDLQMQGSLVLFAWPSLTVLSGYDSDAMRAVNAEARLVDLLQSLTDAGAKRIVLVGHSLGAKLALEAVAGMPKRVASHVLPHLGGIALLSPDISVDAFNEALASFPGQRPTIAVYFSKDDLALQALAVLTDRKTRVGVVNDAAQVKGGKIVLVDVSGQPSSGIGHFAVAAQPGMIEMLRAMSRPDLIGLATALADGANADATVTRAGQTTLVVLPRTKLRLLR